MKRLIKLIIISSLVCLMIPTHSEAKTVPNGIKVKVVNRVYASSPGYIHQQFYAPSNTHTFFQRTWSANYEAPGGIVTEPTDVVPAGTVVTVSFKMLTNLVFQNYKYQRSPNRGNLNTAYATVRFVKFDRIDPATGGPLFTPYDYLLIQKTDIGVAQPFGMMNFKTAKAYTKTFRAPKTGKYALLFELKDLTRDGGDKDNNGYNAYYGIQNVTFKW